MRVEVVFEVAEARVVFRFEVGGDVGLFEAHLADLGGERVSSAVLYIVLVLWWWWWCPSHVQQVCLGGDSPALRLLPARALLC